MIEFVFLGLLAPCTLVQFIENQFCQGKVFACSSEVKMDAAVLILRQGGVPDSNAL